MDSHQTSSTARTAAISLLAAVGFVAFIGASFWLAANATRYVPGVVNRIGSAAVYLGTLFNPAPATLSVVPTPVATTTIPFPTATTTEPVATTSPVIKTPVKTPTTMGPKTTTTYPIGGTGAPANYSGLPDLTVTIQAVGYLASSSADSFIASSSVPAGSRPAVKFTIKNIGTNVMAPWRFSATIPTQTAYLFQSQVQQPLAPGESIEYVLGFDQANRGSGQMISVTANFDKSVAESTTDNNSATAYVTILGS